VDCGYLTVPENRTNAQSPTIRLAVAIFHPPEAQCPTLSSISQEDRAGARWSSFSTPLRSSSSPSWRPTATSSS